MTTHRFGGSWTEEKLDRLRKYLSAYMQIMKNQPFRVAYIDAFAGTGYRDPALQKDEAIEFLPEQFAGPESQEFLKGSASIALEIEPPFHRYVFIERSGKHAAELESLKLNYPARADSIEIQCREANTAIQDLCAESWGSRRAVLFLDPYGMQVTWNTIEAIARTRAIDLWILFPAAIGVNRLLRRDAKIPASWKSRLDQIFGTDEWYSRFYKETTELDLFGEHTSAAKVATIDAIGAYFNERLKSVFPKVAKNPLQLMTPDGRPLYLLCFAAGNEKGAPTAIKIAQDILKAR